MRARIAVGEAMRAHFSGSHPQAHEAGINDVEELYRLLVVAERGELRDARSRHAGAAVPGRAQQPHVRFDSLSDEFGGRRARLRRAAETRSGFRFVSGSMTRLPASCSFLTRPARSQLCARPFRRGCVWPFSKPWIRTSRARTGAADPESAALVRRRRTGCAGTNRRIEGRPRAPAKIRRALRAGLSIDCPSFEHLRPWRRPHDRRKLRQYVDFALLGQRGRRYGAIRFSTDRRARSTAHHGVEKPPRTRKCWVPSRTVSISAWKPPYFPRRSNSCPTSPAI